MVMAGETPEFGKLRPACRPFDGGGRVCLQSLGWAHGLGRPPLQECERGLRGRPTADGPSPRREVCRSMARTDRTGVLVLLIPVRGHVVEKGSQLEVQPGMTSGDEVVIHVSHGPAVRGVLSNMAARADLRAAGQILGVRESPLTFLLATTFILP